VLTHDIEDQDATRVAMMLILPDFVVMYFQVLMNWKLVSEAVQENLLRTFKSFRSLKIHRLYHNKHCTHWQNHKMR
jgi:hypothetical protein